MSRLFKDKLGQDDLEKSASYKQSDYDPALVNDTIKEFLDFIAKTTDHDEHNLMAIKTELFEQRVENYVTTLGSVTDEDFVYQLFLDTLVYQLEWKHEEEANPAFMNFLFSPLVQALYNLEYNGFHLDISGLTIGSPWQMVSHLRGTPDNPLRLTYKGDAYHCGAHLNHCELTAIGKVEVLGFSASHSDFTFRGEAKTLAIEAEQCTFRIPGVDHAHITQLSFPTSFVDYDVSMHTVDGVLHSYFKLPHNFFENKNSLYIPDGEGGWKEVPEE